MWNQNRSTPWVCLHHLTMFRASVRFGRALYVAVMFVVLMVVVSIGLTGLTALLPDSRLLSDGILFKLSLSVPFACAAALLYLFPGRQSGGLSWSPLGPLETSGKSTVRVKILLWLCLLLLIPVGAQGAASILETLSYRIYPDPEMYETIMAMLAPRDHWLDFLGAIVTIGIVAPYCEEVVFRGFILRGYLKSGGAMFTAVILQAVLFALVHANPYQFSYAFPLGILLGYIAIRTHFSLATFWIHAVTNVTAVMGIYGYLPFLPAELNPGEFLPFWFLISGSVMLLVGSFLFFQLYPHRELSWPVPDSSKVAIEDPLLNPDERHGSIDRDELPAPDREKDTQSESKNPYEN
jgi:membrane protease YdiL (CAAX protease family)